MLDCADTVLVVVDIQEKLVRAMHAREELILKARQLVQGARALNADHAGAHAAEGKRDAVEAVARERAVVLPRGAPRRGGIETAGREQRGERQRVQSDGTGIRDHEASLFPWRQAAAGAVRPHGEVHRNPARPVVSTASARGARAARESRR